ncbi:glycosyltransferase family 4 protein [Azorhizophilus paspali]|uniref:Glycosyltransferase family 4 protein n=1 Tax=Azorhizophilus paspali TaxID=69963 RepID=A0ABV6SQ99_AZOPA
MNILFVTWDGPQVTYLESLFLPIFQRLSGTGLQFHVLQFTWADESLIERRRQACRRAGLAYRAQPVRRRPRALGSLLSVLEGVRPIRRMIAEQRIDALMPRSTLPALASLLALRGHGLPMIFDADGLPLDERVEFAGQSPSDPVQRLLRKVEAEAVRRADRVLTRSHQAVEILLARGGPGTAPGKFQVVGNGRDTERFDPGDEASRRRMRESLGVAADAPLLVYAGSLGPQYCAEEMLRLFGFVRRLRADARLLVLSGTPELLRPERFAKLAPAVSCLSVPSEAVPAYLACADLGLALRRGSFSMRGVAPIKLGEYLLCGLPVLASPGIGDTDAIAADGGLLLAGLADAELERAACWFRDQVLTRRDAWRVRCRAIGIRHFSLEACVDTYAAALAPLRASATVRPLRASPSHGEPR